MWLLQLVYCQVHRATPAVCHHVAVSCGGECGHTLEACLVPSALCPLPTHPASSPAPGTKSCLWGWVYVAGSEKLQVFKPQAT